LLVEVVRLAVHAYVLFKVSTGNEREVCEKISNFEEVMTAGIVYGEYDVVAKICVEDLEALKRFLSEKMRSVPSVMLTSTMIIAREYKGKKYRQSK
jgi:DNA-binding Lrp family transcriptional regulator